MPPSSDLSATHSTAADVTGAAPARLTLDRLLARCVELQASDLHLAAGLAPYLRIGGELRPQPGEPALSADVVTQIARELALRAHRGELPERGSLDGAVTGPDGIRFRFNVYRRQGEWSIALRRLEDRFHNLRELGIRTDLYNLCGLNDGLIVVAGPTGAGKSTTLAALIDQINQTRRCHIVTIEDPVEYLHTPNLSLINQRQVGSDAGGFHEALVAALRQDPDVILVGEVRDLPTIRTAITAAETGHLVLTTVHAGDCVGTIERLVAEFPAEEQPGIRRQLSLVLRGVIAQHLLPADGAPSGEGKRESRGRRVPAVEVLMVTTGIAHLIASGRTTQVYSAMETGGQEGMQTLDSDLARLWAADEISELTALHHARDPSLLRERHRTLKFGQRKGT